MTFTGWDSQQYLRFAAERTRPCRDLAARLEITPRTIVDLGCGPGNSTAVLAARWPEARLVGLDSDGDMLARARRDHPQWTWEEGDIAAWAPPAPVDLVFSNAALQWLPDHAALFPRLLGHVAPGGALAVQVPGNWDALPHRLMRELAASASWRGRFTREVREWHTHDLPYYYDALVAHAARLDIWASEYLHVLESAGAIVEFYRGTGLRPFLDALPEGERDRFASDYGASVAAHFQPEADGRVLFPFRRLFIIAYR